MPTGIDVELATEAFRRMGYQVDIVQINWEKKKELVESGDAKTMPIIVVVCSGKRRRVQRKRRQTDRITSSGRC